MAEKTRIITTDNMQTIIAVCFVLALLSLAINFYLYSQIHQVTLGVGNLQFDAAQKVAAVEEQVDKLAALEATTKELQAEVEALQEWKAAEDAEDAEEGE